MTLAGLLPTKQTQFKGRIAFAVVHRDGPETTPWALGVAEENSPGYYPYDATRPLVFATDREAQDAADQLNEALGLSREEASLIVLSTMRSSFRRSRRR